MIWSFVKLKQVSPNLVECEEPRYLGPVEIDLMSSMGLKEVCRRDEAWVQVSGGDQESVVRQRTLDQSTEKSLNDGNHWSHWKLDRKK